MPVQVTLADNVSIADPTRASDYNNLRTDVLQSLEAVDYGSAAELPVSPAVGDVFLVSDDDILYACFDAGTWQVVALASYLRGYIDGFVTENDTDSEHDIKVNPGACTDSLANNDRVIELTSAIVKRIDAAWVEGTTNGGMATGSVAADTEYHLIVINKDSDGSIDVLFDVSATGANKPSGWTARRRIGSVFTEAASNIRGYIQVGDLFRYTGPPLDVNDSIGSLGTLYTGTLSVPAIIERVMAIVMPLISVTSTTTLRGYIKPTDTGETLADENTAMIGYHDGAGSATRQMHFKAAVLADSSAQIEYGVKDEGGGSWGVFRISTIGWIDPRGRNA